MLYDKKMLFDLLIADPIEGSDPSSGPERKSLGTVRSRYLSSKGENLALSYGLACDLAKERGTANPTRALLSLLASNLKESKKAHRIESAGLCDKVCADLLDCSRALDKPDKQGPLTLAKFPQAFNPPFYVVTGDRRETSGRWLTPADFGAVSSSPAELRYLSALGLPPNDTQIITDKIFVLAPMEELQRRFADATLVCCGSPASNHASRILNRFSIHRYDLSRGDYGLIEDFIEDAWYEGTGQKRPPRDRAVNKDEASTNQREFFTAPDLRPNFDTEALKDFQAARQTDIKYIANSIFGGGIIDPTYAKWVRGKNADRNCDFGVITLAQNPFREVNDGHFPALVLSGYHLPGTLYSMSPGIWDNRQSWFESHPYGGVIRVDLKPLTDPKTKAFYAFHERMENFKCEWDDPAGYDSIKLLAALEDLVQGEENSPLSPFDAERIKNFVQRLAMNDVKSK